MGDDLSSAESTLPGVTSQSREAKRKVEPLAFSEEQVSSVAGAFQEIADGARRVSNVGLAVSILVGLGLLMIYLQFGLLTSSSTGANSENFLEYLASHGGSLIVRIGALLIGIFLMQVMLHFVRYNTRMYFHWSMCSALILLSRGNHLIIKDIATTLLPSSIDFGKMPAAPTEKLFEGFAGSVKELAKKIPNSR